MWIEGRQGEGYAQPLFSQNEKQILVSTGWGLGRSNALYRGSRPTRGPRSTDFDPDCARATLSDFATLESTRKPPLHTRGISRARSFDLEVTPWAPTRLTSYISHIGPEESSSASTLSQTAQARP